MYITGAMEVDCWPLTEVCTYINTFGFLLVILPLEPFISRSRVCLIFLPKSNISRVGALWESEYFLKLGSKRNTSKEIDEKIRWSVDNLGRNYLSNVLIVCGRTEDWATHQQGVHGCNAIEEPEGQEILLFLRTLELPVDGDGFVDAGQ